MKAMLDKLVRLAELRRDLAQRAVAHAAAAVAQAQADRDAAIAAAHALAAEQEAAAKALRNPLIGSAQVRGALESVLHTLQADRDRLADAHSAIQTAEAALAARVTQLQAARAELFRCETTREKRIRLRRPILQKLARQAEARAELEQEDRLHEAPQW